MIPYIKRLGFAGISALPLNRLKRYSPVSVISPFHHLVSDEPVPYIEQLYRFKNVRQFEADLDWLLRHFKPLTLGEAIVRGREGSADREPGFLICFDDGLRWVYEVAAPILLRKGVPAAFFINSAFVDNKDIFYNFKKGLLLDRLDTLAKNGSMTTTASGKAILTHSFDIIKADPRNTEQTDPRNTIPPLAGQTNPEPANSGPANSSLPHLPSTEELRKAIRSVNYLNRHLMDELAPVFDLDFESFRKEQRPFMTTEEIRSLIGQGFGIGSHSIDHPLYRLIPLEEQLRQTRVSTQWVGATFQLPYNVFAFPHVDTGVSNDFFDRLFEDKAPEYDLIMGNTTAMLEKRPRVLHRFIGENPAIPIGTMVKSVLAYSALRKKLGKQYVVRSQTA